MNFKQLERAVVAAQLRIRVVESCRSGMPTRAAAKEFKVALSSVKQWKKAWRRGGIEALFLIGPMPRRLRSLFPK